MRQEEMKLSYKYIFVIIISVFLISLIRENFLLHERRNCEKIVDIFSVKTIKIKQGFDEQYTYILQKKEASISFSHWMNIILDGEFPAPSPPWDGDYFDFVITMNSKEGLYLDMSLMYPGDVEIYECIIKENGVVCKSYPLKGHMNNMKLYNYMMNFIPSAIKKDGIKEQIEIKTQPIKPFDSNVDLDVFLDEN